MDKFLSNVQSFFHSVTTNDRYASYDRRGYARSRPAQRRAGSGPDDLEAATEYGGSGSGPAPSDERMARVGILHDNTSMDSVGRSSPYGSRAGSQTNLAATGSSNGGGGRIGYTPGMRSQQVGNGIPLQEYGEGGAPPPPAPGVSWKRIDRWVEANYPELYDQLSEAVTPADLNEIELDLDCSLPLDVRDSYMVHDGQERGGKPAGLFFGITFLDLEGVVEEWTAWKNTAVRLNKMVADQKRKESAANSRVASVASTSSAPPPPHAAPRRRGVPFTELQESVPEGHVQKVYAHPAWIPLAKDFEGNNIGIDLAPGPSGRWGQVILFGRNFDRKYAIAPSWASFLATFADDLYAGDHYIDDDLEDGAFVFVAPNGRQMSYFDVLRGRVDRTLRVQKRQAAPGATAPSRGPSGRLQRAASGALISPVGSTTNLADDKVSSPLRGEPVSAAKSDSKEVKPSEAKSDKETSDHKSDTKSDAKDKDQDKSISESKATTKPETETETETETKPETKPETEANGTSKADKPAPKANKNKKSVADDDNDDDDKDEVDLLKDDHLSEVEM